MFVAKTIAGCEDLAATELKGKVILPQTILFAKLKKNTTTINTIYQLAKKFSFASIEDIVNEAKSIIKMLKKKEIYEIVYSRKGQHPFKGVDVAKDLGMRLREAGYTIDYKKAQKAIYLDIIDNTCLLGMLIADNLCKRPYRVKYNSKSISACIAAALIKIANPKKNDTILDPFCKDGIIPIEAYKQQVKKVHAIDPIRNNVRNALINCKYAKTNIAPQCYEITWLDTLFKKISINHIITNILLSKHDKEPEKYLKEFFHQAEFVVKDAMTIITNKPDLIKSTPSTFKLALEKKISVGEMHYTILKFIREKSTS